MDVLTGEPAKPSEPAIDARPSKPALSKPATDARPKPAMDARQCQQILTQISAKKWGDDDDE
jgi:hypothetical protein